MKTVAAVFPSLMDAERVVRDLRNLGVHPDSIHLVAGNEDKRHDEYLHKAKREETRTAAAAAIGASIGGGVGIVAGLIMLAIPGVGPIIAGGALATVLTGLGIGAAGGGLFGALANMGLSHDEAHLYEEAVRRGQVLVAAQVNDEIESEVSRVMDDHGALDIQHEAEKWRASGWKHPYPNDSSITASEPAGVIEPDPETGSYRVRE
jgi:hypothetical protein